MRRWLGACLALVAAAAIALWDSGTDSRVVAPPPAPTPEPARAVEPPSAAGALVSVESTAQYERVAAEPALLPSDDAGEPTPRAALSTGRLSLRVLEPGGKPWARGALELRVSPTGESEFGFARDTDGGNRANLGRIQVLRGIAGDWMTDSEGRAEIPGIVAGLTFEVRARDAYRNVGGTLVGAPLAPGEVREEVLWLERAARPVEGRCVDEAGAPLQRVRVSVGDGGPRSQTLTDADGRFATPPLFGAELEIDFRRRGLVGKRERVPLPIAAPLEIVLAHARTLTVTLVDERGESFVLHGLQAHGEEGGPRIDTHPEVRDGVHVFESMPYAPVTLRIVGCGPSPTLAVDAATEQVRWSLPRPGEMVVELSRPPQDLPSGLSLELRLSGSGEPVFVQGVALTQLQQPQRWSLFPERYTLQFHSFVGFDPAGRVPFGAPHDFEVRSGATVVVPLGD